MYELGGGVGGWGGGGNEEEIMREAMRRLSSDAEMSAASTAEQCTKQITIMSPVPQESGG